MIDLSAEKLQAVEEAVDVRSIKGSSCHPQSLIDANVKDCDVLIAATNSDEVNLLSAALGKRMGATKTVARIHNRSYTRHSEFDYREQFDIDHLICPEQLTSAAITANLTDPGVVEIESFAHNMIEMHRYEVVDGSKCVGPDLSQISLPDGVRVAVIERNEKFFTPVATTIFEVGDIVTILGSPEQFKQVKSLFHEYQNVNMNLSTTIRIFVLQYES